jgi:hypothetical protein
MMDALWRSTSEANAIPAARSKRARHAGVPARSSILKGNTRKSPE